MLTFCIFVSLVNTWCFVPDPVKNHFVETNKVIARSTEMVTRYEGCSLTAYKDTRGYSIGYGTRSFNGEVITSQEAWARMSAIIRQSVKKISADFPYATENELIALTSLFYNCHTGYKKVKKF
jgi:GH24 family phage-related lysozyme (muramidase)